MINESMNLEIWDRLIQCKSLEGLALETKDGRINLIGLELPDPLILRQFQVGKIHISEIDPGAIIQGARWHNIDFSASKLNALRLYGCDLVNCRFDNCQLRDLRVWETKFSDVSFKGANLRKSVLGGVQNGNRNIYSAVNFSDADLRETVYKATVFEKCDFRRAKLAKIDFQTSSFSDCIFEGELRDVMFYRRGFGGEVFPANEMNNVDLSRATLHDVGFRGLTMERVKLPEDSEHIVIRNVAPMLDKLTMRLAQEGDVTAKRLVAYLNIDREWVVPNQVQAVINIKDMAETVGIEGVNRFLEILRHLS